jgi:hypothetical protein
VFVIFGGHASKHAYKGRREGGDLYDRMPAAGGQRPVLMDRLSRETHGGVPRKRVGTGFGRPGLARAGSVAVTPGVRLRLRPVLLGFRTLNKPDGTRHGCCAGLYQEHIWGR